MRTFRNIGLVLFFSVVAIVIQAQKRTYTKLVWQDNFSVNGLPDSAKWGYDIGNGNNGWGNGEKQYYTNRTDNVKVENGILKIIAKKETY